MNRVIQLHTARVGNTGASVCTLALTATGTLWRYAPDAAVVWKQVPLPPDCGPSASPSAAVKRDASIGAHTPATPVMRLAGGGNA